ncbi:MAG: type II toxin-antitoxin system HicB family antitoxin [Caldiserica bacterium]|nr:MAG: type II toxin-antitoxin system HicB family antitoxin [Caldisericota bacterium]
MAKKLKQIKVRAKLPLMFFKDGSHYIAYCPLLDLSACGYTLKEAKKNFYEVFTIFVEETLSMGTLEEVLEECGFRKVRSTWFPPRIIEKTETVSIQI